MVEESIVFRPDIPDRDVDREVRKFDQQLNDAGTINPEIGDVEGDLDLGGMSGGGGLRGSGPGSPLRAMSGGIDDLVPMADYRNRLLEDILDAVQGGRAGGGGGFISRLLGRLPSLGKLIGGGAVALGALIASKLNPVNLAKILGDKIGDVLPSDLVDPVAIGAGALISSRVAIEAGMLIAEKAAIGVGDLISNPVDVGADALLSALVASPVALTAGQVLDHLVESGSGEGTEQPEGEPSGRGAGVDIGLGQLFAGGALLAGGGTLAAKGLLSGTGLGGFLGGGAASGSITAGGLATLGAGGGGILGALLGGRELAQVASGGQGVEPVTQAGRDFAQSQPGISEFIRTGFTQNPFFDLGAAIGGGGPRVRQDTTRSTRAPQLKNPNRQINVDATYNVDVEAQQDLERELERVKQETLNEVERQQSRGLTGGGRP